MKKLLLFGILLLFSKLTAFTSAEILTYDFSSVDKYARNVPDEMEKDIPTLVQHLVKDKANDLEKVRAIHIWMVQEIKYDYETYETDDFGRVLPGGVYENVHPEVVFKRRTGVCSGYANLFVRMCKDAGIQARVISGISKGAGYKESGYTLSPTTDHAWNAVMIDGRWHLSDVTWDSCTSSTRYFLTRPEAFITEHYPSDGRWQLLEKNLSFLDYRDMANFDPGYFLIHHDYPDLWLRKITTGMKFEILMKPFRDANMVPGMKKNNKWIQLADGFYEYDVVKQSNGTKYIYEFKEPGNYVLHMSFQLPDSSTIVQGVNYELKVKKNGSAPEIPEPLVLKELDQSGITMDAGHAPPSQPEGFGAYIMRSQIGLEFLAGLDTISVRHFLNDFNSTVGGKNVYLIREEVLAIDDLYFRIFTGPLCYSFERFVWAGARLKEYDNSLSGMETVTGLSYNAKMLNHRIGGYMGGSSIGLLIQKFEYDLKAGLPLETLGIGMYYEMEVRKMFNGRLGLLVPIEFHGAYYPLRYMKMGGKYISGAKADTSRIGGYDYVDVNGVPYLSPDFGVAAGGGGKIGIGLVLNALVDWKLSLNLKGDILYSKLSYPFDNPQDWDSESRMINNWGIFLEMGIKMDVMNYVRRLKR